MGVKIEILNHPILTNGKTRAIVAINNNIRSLQGNGIINRSHSIFTIDQIAKLYKSKELLSNKPRGMIKRFNLGVPFMTVFRRTKMYNLKMSDVKIDESGSHPTILIFS